MWCDLNKKILYAGIISAILVATLAAALQNSDLEIKEEESENAVEADIVMPNKVSRPGCEETNSCYVPSQFTVKRGQQVTWSNEDVAFHSVTSGTYENPNPMFDSGHLDPGQKFTVTFDEAGTVDYFCTLHPWMEV